MPPRSPLPPRHGLGAAWLRTPDRSAEPPAWSTMQEWLGDRLGAHVPVAEWLEAGRFVDESGRSLGPSDPYRPHFFVWFHRDLRPEPVVPGTIDVLHRDERLVVVDKPAFLSTIPRGRHVTQSVVVRLRDELGLGELSPVHRLDRVTSGVLVLTTQQRWRGAYQSLFQRREVTKTYRAVAGWVPDLEFPRIVRNHLVKEHGRWQVRELPGAPVNAETLIEVEQVLGDQAVYRLTPTTGRTHQLRSHLNFLGVPIAGDPLYPDVLDVEVDDFSVPLQLLAAELRFVDPIDGTERHFVSSKELPLRAEVDEGPAQGLR